MVTTAIVSPMALKASRMAPSSLPAGCGTMSTNTATYMLAANVQRLTRERMLD